jgi:ATP-dependent Zn protease
MPTEPEVSYSRFVQQIADGQVNKVTIIGNLVTGYDLKGSSFRVILPENQLVMMEALQRHGAEIWFKDASARSWPYWILNCSPILFLAILSAYLAWQARPRRMGT